MIPNKTKARRRPKVKDLQSEELGHPHEDDIDQ
jgi:ribosomal protein S6--L-glutamate ligase